jgi:hypothetical protein
VHLAIVGVYLFIVIHGAGGLSVDNLLRKRLIVRSAAAHAHTAKVP